jgi:hypothetical protein
MAKKKYIDYRQANWIDVAGALIKNPVQRSLPENNKHITGTVPVRYVRRTNVLACSIETSSFLILMGPLRI